MLDAITITKKEALQLYPVLPEEFKGRFNKAFGEEYFSQKITDRVKTFENACEILGYDPIGIVPITTPQDADEKSINAFAKLIAIVRALNEGWTPDWKDTSEYKWTVWPDLSDDSFSGVRYDYWFTHSAVSSRLCFKSRDLAEYAFRQFNQIFKEYFI